MLVRHPMAMVERLRNIDITTDAEFDISGQGCTSKARGNKTTRNKVSIGDIYV